MSDIAHHNTNTTYNFGYLLFLGDLGLSLPPIFLIMDCLKDKIGVKSCGSYDYYLDDYGFSLLKASNIAGSAFESGKDLVNKLINQSISDVVRSIRFDGFSADKMLNDVVFGNLQTDTYTGTKSITFTLDKACKLGTFYLANIEFQAKTAGHVKVELNGTPLFDDDVEAETSYTVEYNNNVSDIFTIKITTDAELYQYISTSTCGCGERTHYSATSSEGNSNAFVQTTFQIRCDISKHLCKFWDKLIHAVIYRTLGKIYFQAYTTDAFNNWINSSAEKTLSLMMYYDSEYMSILDTEGKNAKNFGQYQLEMDLLSKTLPKPTCKCCLDCKDTGWREVIVLP